MREKVFIPIIVVLLVVGALVVVGLSLKNRSESNLSTNQDSKVMETVAPVENVSGLDKVSADLESEDMSQIDVQLNEVSNDSNF